MYAPSAAATPYQAQEYPYADNVVYNEAAGGEYSVAYAGFPGNVSEFQRYGAGNESIVAIDEEGVKNRTKATVILLLLLLVIMTLLLTFVITSSIEASTTASTLLAIPVQSYRPFPNPAGPGAVPRDVSPGGSEEGAPEYPVVTDVLGGTETVYIPQMTEPEPDAKIELCEPAPVHVCPTTTAPGHAAGDVVVFDPSDQSCRKYRPGRNCLAGDNRFRDMDSCEAACTGSQHQPACSEPASLHSCIPGIDTNSSAYYNIALHCLEVDRGSCLRGVGFSSKEECEHTCRGEGAEHKNAVECHSDDVRQCTLTTHLYQVAFIEGRCVQRVNICPKSVGFTSIDHCNKACRNSREPLPLATPTPVM